MIRKIYNEEGIGGFFKGVVAGLFLTINPVIQYIIYEYLKEKFVDGEGNFATGHILWISFISKLITTLVTYPALTVKTIFQSNENLSNKEIIELLYDMLKKNSFRHFYKGISAKMVQTLVNNIILMLTYEKIQERVGMTLISLLLKLAVLMKKSKKK